MKINPFTLEFRGPDRELERHFLRFFYADSLPLFRLASFLGIVLFSSFAFIDAVFMPEAKTQIWQIRFFFVVPVILLGIALSFHRKFIRYWQPTIAVMTCSTALGIFWIVSLGTTPDRYYYFLGTMLVMMFGFTLMRTRFIWAVAIGLIILGMFGITVTFFTQCPTYVALSYGTTFLCLLVIGAVANYCLEYFTRRNFYLMHGLRESEKRLKRSHALLKSQFDALKKAQKEIKVLTGLIPICANCKKIRDDKGYWNQIESYISEHSDAKFSHALGPDCMQELYGNESWFKPGPSKS